MNDYIIKEVRPKSGIMRDIHKEVLGCRCYVVHLQIGEKAIIKFEPRYDPGEFHRLHTSTVENYMTFDGEESITIETRNTIYILERCGGNSHAPDNAWREDTGWL